VVWTLVCSGRSDYSGHPWSVQILDAWGTLDGTSGLDACAAFNTSGRQEIGRFGLINRSPLQLKSARKYLSFTLNSFTYLQIGSSIVINEQLNNKI